MTRGCLDKPKPGKPAVTRPCPSCAGSGAEYPGTTCIVCEGTGWLDAMPWEECDVCKGHGELIDCSFCECCRGSGRTLRWPAEVVLLAEVCVVEQDWYQPVGALHLELRPRPYYALADALEEKGYHELSIHFRSSEPHPRGCAWLDLLLGRE